MENDHKIILKWNWRSPGVASSTTGSFRSSVGGSEGNALCIPLRGHFLLCGS